MKKIILCYLMFVALVDCNKHYIRESANHGQPPVSLDKNLKIALIGFYPYQYFSTTAGKVVTTTAVLDYRNSTKPFFPYGKNIDEFPSSGINQSVSAEKATEVARKYLQTTKRSGIEEIIKVFEVKGEGDSSKFRLKQRNVDYYVVAMHGPAFSDFSWGNLGRFFLTAHIALATLGTIPMWNSVEANTTFLVYDKKLDLVFTKEYTNRYERLTAWWGNKEQGTVQNDYRPDGSYMPELFRPDVDDFSSEFAGWIQSNSK